MKGLRIAPGTESDLSASQTSQIIILPPRQDYQRR
jgi:hypothetical protein